MEEARVFGDYEGDTVDEDHNSMAEIVRISGRDSKLNSYETLGVRGPVMAAATGQLGAVLR